MKIFDCFIFHDELDLLDLRLNYLNHVVDYFVLVESDKTFSGLNKQYYFENNKHLFQKFQHKIIHIKKQSISDYPWDREYEQRNNIVFGLITAENDDIIMLSDVDELPDVSSISAYREILYPRIILFEQQQHYYFFNYVSPNEKWAGTVILPKREITTPQKIRDDRHGFRRYSGGWHFSYLGGVENIIKKIQSFSHTEYNNEKFLNKDNIIKFIENGDDLFYRDSKYVYFDLDYFKNQYPEYLVNNKERFTKYIKIDKQR
jgi:hypothetical protein